MRLITFVLSAFLVTSPAAARTWQEYTNTEYSFTVMFPATPRIETATYQVADGRSVPARTYSVQQNKGVFKVTVADLANAGLSESAVIDHAVKMLSDGNEVKVNFPHRIYQVYGRQLSLVGKDGSRSTVAVFDTNGRLYQIEARVLPGGDDTDLIRFQQSLIFDRDKLSNRSQDTIKAIKEACAGRPNQPNNPAGLDDPRCVRQ